jgi:hypothetical protein
VTLKVIGSLELVQEVFWLDLRTRTCGVRLLNQQTGHERASERAVADLVLVRVDGTLTRDNVEMALGNRAQCIFGELD